MIETEPNGDPQHDFNLLAMQYQLDCQILDMAPEISPARQALIQNGRNLLPFIMEDFKVNPSPWLPLLPIITGENPINRNQTGNVPAMAEAWLAWYKEYRKNDQRPSVTAFTPALGTA